MSGRRCRALLAGAVAAVLISAQASAASAPSPEELLQDAIAAYGAVEIQRSAELFEAAAAAAADVDPPLAGVALNNACNLRNELGDFERALDHCDRALELRVEEDQRGIARTRNNRALSLLELGRFDEAERDLRAALASNRRRDDLDGAVINTTNLALVADARGRYGESLELLAEAEAELRAAEEAAHGEEEVRGAGVAWLRDRRVGIVVNRAVLLSRLGRHDEALRLDRELLEGELDARQRAFVLDNLAVLVQELGDSARALELLDDAENAYRAIGDDLGRASVLLTRGVVRHEGLGLPDAAARDLRAALEAAGDAASRGLELEAGYRLGRVELERGRPAVAAALFRTALERARALGNRNAEASAELGLALAARSAGAAEAAGEHLGRALAAVEVVRDRLRAALDRGSYLASRREIFEAAVVLEAELLDAPPERTLELARRAKQALARREGSGTAPAPPPAAAPEPEAVIEYFVAEERLFRWLDFAGSVSMSEVGPWHPLALAVGRLHEALAAGRAETAAAPELQALISGLDLGPEAESPAVRRVAVAADGRLRYLPFELLDWSATGLQEAPVTRYLLSGDGARSGVSRPRSARALVLGLATFDAGGLGLPARSLPPLDGVEGELERVAHALKRAGLEPTVLRDERATETAFRLRAPGTRLIHFASHAVLDERSEVGSALVLAAQPPGRDGADGVLRPREIAGMELDVGLVVLSACTTSLGTARDGRALDSLVGALRQAGVGGVVASLWDVGDANTRAFMEQLYHRLALGRDAALALHETRQAFRADARWSAHPGLWSAFVLIGESPSLVAREEVPRRRRWRTAALWSGASLAVLGVAALLLRRRGRA